MNWKRAAFVLFFSIALVGCNLPAPSKLPSTTAPALEEPTLAITVIPLQQPTAGPTAAGVNPTTTTVPLPIPSLSPTAPANAASFTPFKATVLVDGAKLRTGPGVLFPAGSLVAKGTEFTVYGHSRGGEWVYVLTGAGGHGWVFGQLVQTEREIQSAPEVQPGDAQIVHGRVVDKSGAPVNGIGFALEQGAALRTDAVTDANGDFYAFFPATASGTWTVSYVAISSTSRLMDKNGNYLPGAAGTIHPDSQDVSLSQAALLTFTWE
jgi:hypothetical protein